MARKRRNRYGWIPDHPDHRDVLFTCKRRVKPLPEKASLRQDWPGILDQGNLGSCVWNAVSYAFLWCLARQSDVIFQPSRLFGYYNTRKMEGTVGEDAGCMIRDAFKTLRRDGVCDEKRWPYKIENFATKPPKRRYEEALDSQSLAYNRVSIDPLDIMSAICEGFPVVIGLALYESFESEKVAKTGQVPMPKRNERMVGGHAVTVIGFDRRAQRFELANSWGNGWGDNGFFTIPFGYVSEDLAADAWVLRLVEGRDREWAETIANYRQSAVS